MRSSLPSLSTRIRFKSASASDPPAETQFELHGDESKTKSCGADR